MYGDSVKVVARDVARWQKKVILDCSSHGFYYNQDVELKESPEMLSPNLGFSDLWTGLKWLDEL